MLNKGSNEINGNSEQCQGLNFPLSACIPFPSEPIVDVGYDNSNTKSMFAERGSVLRTEGLMNCIAVVVYTADGAVMRHYDTMKACSGSRYDVISGAECLEFSVEALWELREDMIEQLFDNIGGGWINSSTPRFAISLGAMWTNIAPSSSLNLLKAIITVFNVEPTHVGSVASFDTRTSRLTTSNH